MHFYACYTITHNYIMVQKDEDFEREIVRAVCTGIEDVSVGGGSY